MRSLLFILFFVFVASTSAVSPMSSFTRILYDLRRQVQRRPSVTNGVVGLVLFGASDVFAQQLETAQEETRKHKNENPMSLVRVPTMDELDLRRLLCAGALGAFFAGSVYPFAYRQLDSIWKGNDLLSICKKSIAEIFTVGIFANSVSMACRGVLKGNDPNQVMSHVANEMPSVTLNDIRVWFPYNMVAFGIIPASVRPATTSLMEACWQTYISLRSNDYDHATAKTDTTTTTTTTTTIITAIL
jgi:hypothetical protein